MITDKTEIEYKCIILESWFQRKINIKVVSIQKNCDY